MYLKNIKVPVPADARAYSNGQVRQVRPPGPGERWSQKKLIGKIPIDSPDYRPEDYVTAEGIQLMIPNENYRNEYSYEFARYMEDTFPDEKLHFPPKSISVGCYLLILGVAYQLGLYQLLCDVFNIEFANAILDLAMYYIMYNDNDISKMAHNMEKQLVFSIEALPDDWYSETFDQYAVDCDPDADFGEYRVCEFMKRWAQLRSESGLTDAFLRLEGTHFEHQSLCDTEAEPGCAEAERINIVGIMAAVQADGDNKGMPLAYVVDPGSQSDVTTAQDVLTFFTDMGLKIKTLLADDNFSYSDVVELCDSMDVPFLMMLKTTYQAFSTMMKKYRDLIFWNWYYWIEGNANLYGISENNVSVFSEGSQNSDRKCCVALFFDGTASEQGMVRDNEILNIELRRVQEMLKEFNASGEIEEVLAHGSCVGDPSEKVLATLNAKNIVVSEKFRDTLSLEYDPEKRKVITKISNKSLTEKYKEFGYFCMASSVLKSAQEMSDDYMLKDASEKDFRAMKTELELRTASTSDSRVFRAKIFSCFISDIIRNEIERIFMQYEMEKGCIIGTDEMILSFSDLCYTRDGSNYAYSGEITAIQCEILENLGISQEAIKILSPFVEARFSEQDIKKLRSMKREIPAVPKMRKPGRQKGNKNKSNNHDVQTNGTGTQVQNKANVEPGGTETMTDSSPSPGDPYEAPKRHRGRPKGSKNKKTLEREAQETAEKERRVALGLPAEEPKFGRGRRKGSKNKKTLEREAQEAAEKERRIAAGLPTEELKPVHRGGRPKGSKNKKHDS